MALTLLLTNSIDYVSDVIVERLGQEKVFRYNSDLWQDYSLTVTEQSISIENPAGKRITDKDIAKVYRRSTARASTLFPERELSAGERYAEEEVWSAWNDIVNIFWHQDKIVLTQPYATMRSGKLHQLRVAHKYFKTTPYRFLINDPASLNPDQSSVVKSFSFRFTTGVGFYTQKIKELDLDPRQPWFLSNFIDANDDVTIAFVRDELFAYRLDRSEFIDETIDWRQAPSEYAHRAWQPVVLPDALSKAIFSFMQECGAHFGRLDFLKTDDDYIFLEVNFTGEWLWLDAEGDNGLLNKILHEIDPTTPCHSCPRPQW
jgi:hypothetical protein